MKADKKKALTSLKIAKGQIDGIIKMIENNEYCLDISNQVLSTRAILARVNTDIISAHIESCVVEAIEKDIDKKEKLEEVKKILEKLTK